MSEPLPSDLAELYEQAHSEQDLEKLLEPAENERVPGPTTSRTRNG